MSAYQWHKTLLLCPVFLCLSSCAAIAQPSAKEVLSITHKVANWQLEHPNGKRFYTWEYGTFFSGLMSLYKTDPQPAYLASIQTIGSEINWELRPRPYDANVYAIGHALWELYEIKQESYMVDKILYTMEMPLARRLDAEVAFADNKYWWEWWTWCDALFMAPPTFVRAAVILKQPKYMTYMVEMWKKTADYLYNKEDHLYFRDDRFFNKKSRNGQPIYWSRGNGWVIGGLCKVLDYMPKDHADRPYFEQQFLEMATKLAAIQLKNGYWSISLLDPEDYPQKETSGTAFFCYALAWGINHGYLEKKEFLPNVLSAWQALVDTIEPSGKMGFVQRVGDQPDNVKREDTEVYGTGAFLLAGSEVYKLLQ